MTERQVLPVALSIVVIIIIAVIRSYSKALAAITATMPITIPLTLWIVYTAEKGNRRSMQDFTGSLFSGLLATVVFTFTIWLAARAGLRLVPMLAAGYLSWMVALGLMYALRLLLANG
ncbi:MAG TPA: hypothetical protein VHP83_13745 [Aggregatilineaceae bacterium]|nr:hypothetical protein [Aggregatilineaceae bacterium]